MASTGGEPLTHVMVTYSMTADDEWERFGKIATPAYLWCKAAAGADPIVEVKVVVDDEEAGAGFEKLPEDLNKGLTAGGGSAFLCVRREANADNPLVGLRVISEEDPEEPGFTKLDTDLMRGAGALKYFLYTKDKKSGESGKKFRDFELGDQVDVVDTIQKWCVGQVVEVSEDGEKVYIHYDGWSDKWNEWIKKTSPRLAIFRTHTRGKDTGPSENASSFRLTGENMDKFMEVNKKLDEIVEKKEWSKEDKVFVTAENMKFVAHTLRAVIDDPKNVPLAVAYLHKNIKLIVERMAGPDELETPFGDALVRLFDGDVRCKRFYQKYGLDARTNKIKDGDFAGKPPKDSQGQTPVVSCYLVENINLFGSLGGFKAFAERLADKTRVTSFHTIKQIIWALFAARSYYKSKFIKKFMKSIMGPVFDRIRNIADDELKTLDKDAINEVLKHMEHLMVAGNVKDVEQFIEHFSLDVALRLLTSKLLEKRINGMAELRATIEKVLRKEAGHARHGGAKFLTSKYLIQWIRQHDVVDVLLGPSSHQELIKRAPAVLKFMAYCKALNSKDLDLLWEASIGKHESLVRVVYDAVAELASELAQKHLEYLFNHVRNVKEHNELSLHFLRSFTINAVRRQHARGAYKGVRPRDANYFGLSILWDLIQDGSPLVDEELLAYSKNTLCELLANNEYDSQKLVYVEAGLKNLAESKSVPQTLEVLRNVMESCPIHAGHGVTIDDVILALQKGKVIDLVVHNIERYNGLALEQSKESKDEKSEENLGNTVFVGRHSHNDWNEYQLDFLEYLLANSKALLPQKHIDTLWKAMVTNCVIPEDRSYLLQWLKDAQDETRKSYFEAFNDDVTEYIFDELLCKKLDLTDLSKRGYRCFQVFFLHVNRVHGYLEAGTQQNPRARLAIHEYFKLKGLDSLWTIATQSSRPDAATMASRFLVHLHTRLCGALPVKEIFGHFVKIAMTDMKKAVQNIDAGTDVEKNTKTANSLVRLLENFLGHIELKDEHDYDYVYQPTKLALLVVIHYKKDDVKRVSITLSPNNRIGEVRRELRKALADDPNWGRSKFKIVYRDTTLTEEDDDKTITDIEMKGPQDSIAVHRVTEDESGKSLDDEVSITMYPRLLLADDKENFDVLFHLLRVGGEAGQAVWKLLTRLPTNRTLRETVLQSVDEKAPNWNKILDPNAVLKLFYTMRLMDRHITVNEKSSDAERSDKAKWVDSFVKKGGFQHLYGALMGLDLDEIFSRPLNQQCLTLLVKQIFSFYKQGAKEIADSIMDYPKLMNKLMSILHRSLEVEINTELPKRRRKRDDEKQDLPRFTEAEVNQSRLVLKVLHTIIALIKSDVELLNPVYEFGKLSELVKAGLVTHKSFKVRNTVKAGVYQICALFDEVKTEDDEVPALPKPKIMPRTRFLPLLLGFLPSVDEHASTCNEYFQLISLLLKKADPKSGAFDATSLGQLLADKIAARPIQEIRASDVDVLLVGLLNLTRELVTVAPQLQVPLGQDQDLIMEMFHNCLFAVPTANDRALPPPKCKSAVSRKAAYGLLQSLVNGCEVNYRRLVKLLIPNHMVTHSNGRNPREWEFEAKDEEKSESGYVGLRNLGCTCYMNSFVQQMFMIPDLRKSILAVPDEEEDKKESFFYQLQYIFSFLQESDKQYYDPKQFCHAFKDWDGNPTNVGIQMDTQEFLNMLFDRIDTKVKGSDHERVLKNSLGGVFSNELICKGCPHYKERDEDFYAISVNVKNKKTLDESIAEFVKGEMLEGDNAYLCGVCKKKVDTLKRVCIKKLPNTLVFHLKRFEFNFDTMQKVKLNSKLEFPIDEVLDVKKYCKVSMTDTKGKSNMEQQEKAADGKESDGKAAEEEEEESLPDSHYKYRLSGILIHTGSADRGHYYSFIKERLPKRDRVKGVKPKWMEFNDTHVREMDPADLPNEAFGGPQEVRRSMYGDATPGAYAARANSQGQAAAMEKYANAYLLFYDRIDPDEDAPAPPEEKEEKKQSAAVVEDVSQPPVLRQRSQSVMVTVPEPIFKDIWDENMTYWRDLHVFDPDYFSFLMNLVTSIEFKEDKTLALPEESNLSHSVTELATRFVLETLTRSRYKESLSTCMKHLKDRFEASVPSSLWFLKEAASNPKWLSDFLLVCRNPDVRRHVGTLYCSVMNNVAEHLTAKVPTAADAKDAGEAVHANVADALLGLLPRAPAHWKRFDQFFRVLAHFTSLGPAETRYLARKGVVSVLVDFYLGAASPHPEVGILKASGGKGKRIAMADDWGNRPDYAFFLNCVADLVCASQPSATEQKTTAPTLLGEPQDAVVLSKIDQEMLLCKPFMSMILREGVTRKRGAAVSRIICHWCWENMGVTESVVGYITDGIEELTYLQMRSYFRVLMAMVKMEDSLQEKRVHVIFSSLLAVMKIQWKYWRCTALCVDHVIRMAKKSPAVFKWLNENGKKLDWIVNWMQKYPRPTDYDEVQLYKPQFQQQWGMRYSNLNISAADMGAAITSIKDGKPLDDADASDSDEDLNDRVFEVGQWIDCKDTVAAWCRAWIEEIRDNEVFVHYDGWSKKWNEWLHVSDPRIARFGRYTADVPEDKLKGDGPKPGDNLGWGRVYNPDEEEEEEDEEMED